MTNVIYLVCTAVIWHGYFSGTLKAKSRWSFINTIINPHCLIKMFPWSQPQGYWGHQPTDSPLHIWVSMTHTLSLLFHTVWSWIAYTLFLMPHNWTPVQRTHHYQQTLNITPQSSTRPVRFRLDGAGSKVGVEGGRWRGGEGELCRKCWEGRSKMTSNGSSRPAGSLEDHLQHHLQWALSLQQERLFKGFKNADDKGGWLLSGNISILKQDRNGLIFE